jgi:serine/threonine protein kinase
MADRSGQTIGSYRLLRLLGESGFAETYLGEHSQTQEQAVIKLLTPRSPAADFAAWTTRMARLQHPQLCKVRETGAHENRPFYAMPYYSDGSLRALHPSGEQVPLPLVASYLQHIVPLLTSLHQQKTQHLNLKPENLLLSSPTTVMVSDIALGPRITRYVSPEQAVAWAVYMAPEQFANQPTTTPATDQYSLAVIVYEWLCGQPPFQGQAFLFLSGQHRDVAPTPLRAHDPSIPAAIEKVVLKALSKRPRDRFPSVQKFAEAFVRGLPVSKELTPDSPAGDDVLPTSPEQHSLVLTLDKPAEQPSDTDKPTPSPPPPRRSRVAALVSAPLVVVLLVGSLLGLGLAGKGPFSSLHSAHAARPTATTVPTATPIPIGTITEFLVSSNVGAANWITAGPDGNLWFTDKSSSGRIGRISHQGAITELPLPNSKAIT